MKLMRYAALVCLASIALLHAEEEKITLQLSNGDRLQGALIETTETAYIIQSPILGRLEIPRDQATVVQPEVLEIPTEAQMMVATDDPSLGLAETTEEAADLPEERTLSERVADTWQDWVSSVVPEGWSGRASFGLAQTNTTSKKFEITTRLTASKTSGLNTYTPRLFYNYTRETSVAGVTSTTTDNYGAGFDWRRNLDDYINNRWYLESDTGYRVDEVKNIRHEATQFLFLGYKLWDTDDLKIDVSAGPGLRYIDAAGFDQKWLFLPAIRQSISYKLNSILRFEQSGTYAINAGNVNQQSMTFNAGLIAAVSRVFDVALRYSNQYDTIVAPGALKTEERITLAIELPF